MRVMQFREEAVWSQPVGMHGPALESLFLATHIYINYPTSTFRKRI